MQQQKPEEHNKEVTKAKAWKPPQPKKLKHKMKLMPGNKLKIATLNSRGTRTLGVRNTVARLTKTNINRLAFQ